MTVPRQPRAIVALEPRAGELLAAELRIEGIDVIASFTPDELADALADEGVGEGRRVWAALREADTVVLPASRHALTVEVVSACDRQGVRIVALGDTAAEERLAEAFGLDAPLSAHAEPWMVARAVTTSSPRVIVAPQDTDRARIIAVWGPSGAPGRSTLAVELAVELSRGGRHVGLIDADTHAPSIALALGLADEGPGFAAACRQSELGGLDARELSRISVPLSRPDGEIDVLTGLNRPSRWPELTGSRVSAALTASRAWADYVVVDVAASIERDEEIVSDLDGPRRNAATLAALAAADQIVAVASADPVGMARFLRGYSELRALVGSTPITVVANRLRPGPLGIDARGQVRRTLERFAGITQVVFVPHDVRAVDAAMLSARPIADAAPRSALVQGVRRLAGEVATPPRAPAAAAASPGVNPATDERTPRRATRRKASLLTRRTA